MDIQATLKKHAAWLRGHKEGVRANLRGANLQSANLQSAYLRGAYLQSANLQSANLQGANLWGADLRSANLRSANLRSANLRSADLRGADLQGANLRGAEGLEQTIIVAEGDLIVWKACRDGILAKLKIPAAAKRSNATGRKCRAEYARVLEVVGADVGYSLHTNKPLYRRGKTVRCDKWEEDRWVECGGGIHFFLTRAEAEAY